MDTSTVPASGADGPGLVHDRAIGDILAVSLVLRGQFTPIYTDYYLHLMQHGIRHPGNYRRC